MPSPREWEDPQAKRGGGMERSGSLCGRVAAPRETLHGRQCGSIGKQLPAGALRATAGAPWRRNWRRHGGAPSGRSCKLTYALCGFGCQFELQLEEEIYDLYCISLRLYCKNRQIIIKQLLYFLFRSTRGMEQKPPLVIQKERLFRV